MEIIDANLSNFLQYNVVKVFYLPDELESCIRSRYEILGSVIFDMGIVSMDHSASRKTQSHILRPSIASVGQACLAEGNDLIS
jgi:hypothetical protein